MARSLTTGLTTHLAGRMFVPVDLYEITISGTVYRYTTHVSDLTGVAPASVATYSSGVMQAGAQRQGAGLIVDDLEVTVLHGGTATVGGSTWVARANLYQLDRAAFRRLEGFLDVTSGTLIGCAESFVGVITSVEPASTQLRLVASVETKQFKDGFPSLTCQAGCIWNFGSSDCGYSGTTTFTATVAAASTATKVRVTAVPSGLPGASPGVHYFHQGTVVLGGYTRTVVDVLDDGYALPCLVVAPAFPAGLVEAAISGSITLHAGCTKTATVCNEHWGRLASYLGVPMAPGSSDAA